MIRYRCKEIDLCKEAKSIVESKRLDHNRPTITAQSDENPGTGEEGDDYTFQYKRVLVLHGDLIRAMDVERER